VKILTLYDDFIFRLGATQEEIYVEKG